MAVRRLLIAVLACSLLLSGCAEDDPPPALPTPSPAPTGGAFAESASPIPEPEPETAREFIGRWRQVETRMITSGDTDEYLVYAEGCTPCEALAARISGFYANGGYAKTSEPQIVSIKRVNASGRQRAFRVTTVAGPTRYKTSKSASVKRLEGGPATYELTIERTENAWRLINLVELSTLR